MNPGKSFKNVMFFAWTVNSAFGSWGVRNVVLGTWERKSYVTRTLIRVPPLPVSDSRLAGKPDELQNRFRTLHNKRNF
eukprot:664655-Amphidinium_carterae.1